MHALAQRDCGSGAFLLAVYMVAAAGAASARGPDLPTALQNDFKAFELRMAEVDTLGAAGVGVRLAEALGFGLGLECVA